MKGIYFSLHFLHSNQELWCVHVWRRRGDLLLVSFVGTEFLMATPFWGGKCICRHTLHVFIQSQLTHKIIESCSYAWQTRRRASGAS